MKKLVSILIAMAILLFNLSAYAGGESVSMPFENDTYNLALVSTEVVNGVLNVQVSGFGNTMHMRDGKIVIPFWVYAVSEGETYPSSSVTCDSSGINTYTVECGNIPEEIYIYANEDEDHPVLLWKNPGTPETAQENSAADRTAIPDELIGIWHGTGTPVGGSNTITLEITVNADGSGVYTFDQAGYTESYPFTLESDNNHFSVSIPEDNYLGIVSCEGTYTYEDGILSLHIITTFANGQPYEYTADCTKEDASAESDTPAFCGEWQLDSIVFFTPDSDNGIFSIDATLGGLQGSQYGSNLMFNTDGTMVSDIDLNSLIAAIPQLPFSISDLCLSDYSEWSYAQDSLSFLPDGIVLALVYDEAASQLRLTLSATVDIQASSTDAGTTKAGEVDIEITLVLIRAEAQETT
jgi:hypothetical protein